MSTNILAAGAVNAGLIDNITSLAGESQTAVNAVVSVALLAFVALVTFKNGFSLARLLMSALVAGFCAWLVLGQGIFTVQNQVGEDVGASGPVVVVVGDRHLV